LIDISPEYWAGWALAYYQWLRNIPFEEILDAVPMEKIVRSYYPLHEADIRKFVEVMDVWMAEKNIHAPEIQ
ncbi:MAG: transcriptional regulator, partial [Selenomonas massiliensis]